MKKIQLVAAASLAGLLLLTGAARTLAQIEVVDEKTVKVQATGLAEGIKDKKEREAAAFDNALHNAIELVVNDMIRTEDEKKKFNEVKDQFYKDVNKYVLGFRYTNKSNFDKPLYRTNVALSVDENKDLIQQTLVSLGVIQSAQKVREELNRFTIMPYLDTANSSPEAVKYKDLFYTRVRVFFEDQGIPTIGQDEIQAIEADNQAIAMQKGSAGATGEEDPILQLARNTPADILVKITAQIETGTYGGATTKKVILTVGAYNVMTGEFIGSGQGFSEPLALSSVGASVGAGIDQAMNSAMSKVMDRITSFWREYVKEGRPIKLIFTDFSFGDMRWVTDALKSMTNDQKRMKAAGNISEYIVWYDGTPEDLMYALYDVLQKHDISLAEDPSMVSNQIMFYKKKS